MKKKVWTLALACCFLVGCSSSAKVDSNQAATIDKQSSNNDSVEEYLTKAIQEKVKGRYSTSKDLRITDVSIEGSSGFANVLFTVENVLYEGIIYAYHTADSWTIENDDFTIMDNNSPMTIHQVSGVIHGQSNSTYMITSGYLNDRRIREVHLDYPEQGLTIIKIGDQQKTYFDTKIGLSEGSKEVIGFDENGKELFHK